MTMTKTMTSSSGRALFVQRHAARLLGPDLFIKAPYDRRIDRLIRIVSTLPQKKERRSDPSSSCPTPPFLCEFIFKKNKYSVVVRGVQFHFTAARTVLGRQAGLGPAWKKGPFMETRGLA
jgi:hypothetical protein